MEISGAVSIDFNLTDFYFSRPSNKIYVAYFMYLAFLFHPSICDHWKSTVIEK